MSKVKDRFVVCKVCKKELALGPGKFGYEVMNKHLKEHRG